MKSSVGSPLAIHRMIEHLISVPEDRALLKSAPEQLFTRFQVPEEHYPALLNSERDALAAIGVHGNYVVKWLIWTGRPTMPFFALSYYFDRR
ncbi:hypothetical protein TERTU_1261 [Teredinibacter turnerae T7901]|uniref:Extradiol ring-cleavage dioxygenase LigAB LigA subunit domain-containing protein n=1 Tax=Teredinibacter turnerae (strain ATCC 39867 / T7901) TaxID=377629 RepID=C5BRU9_TERTT|nr:hypothetical protein [Teredinibacter turnerae]ACR11501.1 hypothetical protein TERTU_1261 [Teredinibacter turnerae T7901]